MTFNFEIKECIFHGEYASIHATCPTCERLGMNPSLPIVETTKPLMPVAPRKAKVEKAPKPRKISPLEKKFMEEWAKTGLPMPMAEYKFHPVRKWRFDFCFVNVDRRLAIELDGKPYGGRHTRGGGFIADLEKLNAAIELGYFVLRYTKIDEDAIAQVRRVYERL